MLNNFRRRRIDHLGLRSALADRMLPLLVGAMSFLAALAIAGTLASASLAAHWQGDTASALTIQIPNPTGPDAAGAGTRLSAVLAALQTSLGIANAHKLSTAEINRLLAPWLGDNAASLALPIPAVISADWQGSSPPDALAASLAKLAPGTFVSTGASWAKNIAALTASLQACAAAILVIVALVGAAMVGLATRSGLAQRRETIEIIHGLGALDSDIADRFAARATTLTFAGALSGTILALPILFWLATLAAPFASVVPSSGLPPLPSALWTALPILPLMAACIGWSTAQITVRGWLKHLA